MKKTFLLLFLLILCSAANAESVTYRIEGFNKNAGDFTIAAIGTVPTGSYAQFESEFGSTIGNRYNQIPKNKQATLWLVGYEGCTIQKVTLWMCSNNKAGSFSLKVNAGEQSLYSCGTMSFNEWYGQWVSKDLGVYVDISREMTVQTEVPEDEDVAITIKSGSQDGSVYIDAVTIDYIPAPIQETESPLGWMFEKLEAKSSLADGDVIMLYRSGDAAGDFDGMEKSHYLDAIGIASTANVVEPFVTYFTLNKTADGHWTMTNQYGEQLGATSGDALAWDNGVTTWDISLGYSGATIASTNAKYGTIRYNVPSGSWPRFRNYTSTSLTLPYIYRRVRQLEPVISTQIKLAYSERTVALSEQDTVVFLTSFLPATTTDKRVSWTSSDESIATVNAGIVNLHSTGTVTITATAYDGGSTTKCELTILEVPVCVKSINTNKKHSTTIYNIDGTIATRHRGLLVEDGKIVLVKE